MNFSLLIEVPKFGLYCNMSGRVVEIGSTAAAF